MNRFLKNVHIARVRAHTGREAERIGRMDIFQIRYFISAVTMGSFSAAAAENNISQSSFSKQIMSLEAELGVELFSRKHRSITLTPPGRCFLDHAYAILGDYTRMLSDISKFVVDNSETINITAIPVMTQYHLTEAMSEFHAVHPKVSFNLTETESEMVLKSLRSMETDFAVLRTDFLDPTQFNIRPLVDDKLIAVVSKNHPLASRGKVSLAELKNERFILPTTQSDLNRICINACQKAGFTPNVVFAISGKPEITLGFVRRGDAITLAMDKVMNYKNIEGCQVLTLEEDVISTTALVWLKSVALGPACRVFENFLMIRMHS